MANYQVVLIMYTLHSLVDIIETELCSVQSAACFVSTSF